MSSGRDQLTNPSRRLPDLSLPASSTGALTPVRRPGREARVVVLVHGSDCAECREYLEQLTRDRQSILDWDGLIFVVTPGAPGETGHSGSVLEAPFLLLSDPAGSLARSVSLQAPAVAVADQWGEIHAGENAGPDHQFLAPAEIIGWLRFLATQCPECQGEAF
jgi:peroxiredoxin